MTQDPIKRQKLYEYLSSNKMTDLSMEEFSSKYSEGEHFEKLYGYLKENKMTELEADKFQQEYFGDLKKSTKERVAAEPVKKKEEASPSTGEAENISSVPSTRVAARNGVKMNPDGKESTHRMTYGKVDGGKYAAYPTLFQNEDGSWLEVPKEEAFQEAKKRGEVNVFDSEEEAKKFAAGSWKPARPLTEQQYKEAQLQQAKENVLAAEQAHLPRVEKFEEATELNEQDIKTASSRVQEKMDGTFWDKVGEFTTDAMNTMDKVLTFGLGFPKEKSFETYKEEKQAKAEKALLKEGKPVTPKALEEKTLEIAHKDEVKNKKLEKVISYVEALPEEEKEALELESLAKAKTPQLKEKAMMMEMQLDMEKAKELDRQLEYHAETFKRFEQEGRQDEIPQDLIETYNKRYEIRKQLAEKYEDFNEELASNYDKALDAEEALTLVKKNYGFLANMEAQATVAAGRLYRGAVGLMAYGYNAGNALNPNETSAQRAEEFVQHGIAVQEQMTKIEEAHRPRMEYSNINGFEDLGYFVAQETTAQLPIITAMATTGMAGVAGVSASTGGEKFIDMKMEERDPFFPRDYSLFQEITAPVLHGGSEFLFGQLPTFKILRRAANPQTRQLLVKGFTKQLGEFAEDNLIEVGTEVLTTVAQNSVDRYVLGKHDVQINDNIDHTIFATLASSPVYTGSARVVGQITKPFMPESNLTAMRNNARKIMELQEQYEAAESPEAKEVLSRQIEAQQEQGVALMNSTMDGVSRIGQEAYRKTQEITQKQGELQARAQMINRDKGLTKEQKKSVLDDMKAEFAELESQRQLANETLKSAVEKAKKGEPLSSDEIQATNLSDEVIGDTTVGKVVEDLVEEHGEKAQKEPLLTLEQQNEQLEKEIAKEEDRNKLNKMRGIRQRNRAAIDKIKNYERDTRRKRKELSENREAAGERKAEKRPSQSDPVVVRRSKERPAVEAIDDGGVYTRDGERGFITQDGQQLVFETPTKIHELGNIDELSASTLAELGFEVEGEIDIEYQDDNTVSIEGEVFYTDPKNADKPIEFITNSKGNHSITLFNIDGQRRTFRGAVADKIAYDLTLKQFEQNATPEQRQRAEQRAEQELQAQERAREAADKKTVGDTPAEQIKSKPAESIAAALRAAKGRKDLTSAFSQFNSAPLEIIMFAWDSTLEAAATAIELGATAATTMKVSVDALRKSPFYKKLERTGQRIAEEITRMQIGELLGLGRVDTAITASNSYNYANMTEDENGDFVFVHYSSEQRDVIDPSKYGKNSITSREEAAAIGKVGGVSMFYTKTEDQETGTGKVGHRVIVAKEKVYDANRDPMRLVEVARKKHKKQYPDAAFDANTQMAYITKIAADHGFDMVVMQWGKKTRAQTTKKLVPQEVEIREGNRLVKWFDKEYPSNKEKGYRPIIPLSKAEKMKEVYDAIHKQRGYTYDKLYHLRMDYSKYTQQEITELVDNSDLPQELKDQYHEALEYQEESFRSERASKVKIKTEGNNFSERIEAIKKSQSEGDKGDFGETFTQNGEVVLLTGDQDVVTLGSVNVDADQLSEETVQKFIEANKAVFEQAPDVVVGVFKLEKGDGYSIDLNVLADSRFRENNVKLAGQNNQESIFNMADDVVPAGGNGQTTITDQKDMILLAEALVKGQNFDFSIAEQTMKERMNLLAEFIRDNFKVNRTVADAMRNFNSTPIEAVWDGAVELIATTIEAGGTIAEAISKAMKYFRESDYFKNLESNKSEAYKVFKSKVIELLEPYQGVDKPFEKAVKEIEKKTGARKPQNTKKKNEIRKETGQTDTSPKRTISERQLLKEQYAIESKAARDAYRAAIRDVKDKAAAFRETLNVIMSRSPLSAAKTKQFMKSASKVGTMNEKELSNLFDQIGRAVTLANMKVNLTRLEANKEAIRGRIKNRFNINGPMAQKLVHLEVGNIPMGWLGEYLQVMEHLARETGIEWGRVEALLDTALEAAYQRQIQAEYDARMAEVKEAEDKTKEVALFEEIMDNFSWREGSKYRRKQDEDRIKEFLTIPREWIIENVSKKRLSALNKALVEIENGSITNKGIQDIILMYQGDNIFNDMRQKIGKTFIRPIKDMFSAVVANRKGVRAFAEKQYETAINSVMVKHIDTVVTRIKGLDLYGKVMHPITAAFNKAHVKSMKTEAKFSALVNAARRSREGNRLQRLLPSILEGLNLRKANYRFDLQVIIQFYLRQKEYDNPANMELAGKKIFSAKEHFDATMANASLTPYSKESLDRIKKIYEQFADAEGNFDIARVQAYFTQAEMEVIKYIREVLDNETRVQSMEINDHYRGETLYYPEDYFPRKTYSEEEQHTDGIDVKNNIAGIMGSTNTKAGASNTRTATKADPLNFNTFSTFLNHVKDSNIEYEVSEGVKLAGIITTKMKNVSMDENASISMLGKALENGINVILEAELGKSIYTPESKSYVVYKTLVRNTFNRMLIDLPRLIFADGPFNFIPFYLFNIDRIGGIKKATSKLNKDYDIGLKDKDGKSVKTRFKDILFKDFASTQESRLAGSRNVDHRESEVSTFGKGRDKQFSQSIGGNIVDMFSKNKVKDFGDKAGELYYKAADAPAKHIWSYRFDKAFKKAAGFEFDTDAYMSDPDYKLKNKAAIKAAILAADKHTTDLFNTATKTEQKIYNQARRGGFWNSVNTFMRSFSFNENRVFWDSVNSMFGKGTMDRGEAFRTFMLVTTRSIGYSFMIQTMVSTILNAILPVMELGEEEDDLYEKAFYRSLAQHGMLLAAGNKGLLWNTGLAMAIEQAREIQHNMDPFNEEKYDSFEDGLFFTPRERGSLGDYVNMMGAEGYAMAIIMDTAELGVNMIEKELTTLEGVTEEDLIKWKAFQIAISLFSQATGAPINRLGNMGQKYMTEKQKMFEE